MAESLGIQKGTLRILATAKLGSFDCHPFSFEQKPTTDYDSVLARLANDITEAKTHLAEIKLRERRISLLLNLYGISLWVVWIGLYWLGGIPWGIVGLHDDSFAQIIELAVILVWPIG